MTLKDKLEIGLKEDAPFRRTTSLTTRSAGRNFPQDLADPPRSRWPVVTRTSCPKRTIQTTLRRERRTIETD